MANGVRNTLVSVVAGLAIGAAAIFSPQAALSKNPKIHAPAPSTAHDFNKEKDKIEKSALGPSSISKSGPASYSIPGLSVEPATTPALVRRLEHAQVIIQGMDHTFDLGRDKGTQLLRQLRSPLNIGSVFIEEFHKEGQDSLTAFCTTGQPNLLTQAVVYTSWPRGPHTRYSLMLLLSQARALDMDLVALSPDRKQPKYNFMHKPNPDLCRYIDLANVDMLASVLEQLRLHPGQRLLVQMGSGHVKRFQKLLDAAGVSSASFEVWAPDMAIKPSKKRDANDWLAPMLNLADARYAKYLPRLRGSVSGDALIDKASPASDFVLYTQDKQYWDEDYMRLMPQYFEREIRYFESKLGREWMVEHGVMDSTGTLTNGFIQP